MSSPPPPAYTIPGKPAPAPPPAYTIPSKSAPSPPPPPAYTIPAKSAPAPKPKPAPRPRPAGPAPRKWLMDRIQGQSKYNDRERPPAPCCWVSPVVGWCPALCETNILCSGLGRMGFSQNEFFRFACLHVGFVANILAMLATSYAAMAISLEYFILSKSSMEILEARDLKGNLGEVVTIYLGLRGVAFDQPSQASSPLGRQAVFDYDDLCALYGSNSGMYLDDRKDCGSCASNYFSMNAVMSLMIAVPLFFPTFFSQQLRMYSGYDVNCTKNFLSLLSLCIVLLNLNVMLSYFFLCSKESFYEEDKVYLGPLGTRVSSEVDAYYEMEFTWTWGWGLIALIAGTGLKVIDLLCNIAVPTPKVAWDRKEQDIYETILFVDPSEDGGDDDDDDDDDEEDGSTDDEQTGR